MSTFFCNDCGYEGRPQRYDHDNCPQCTPLSPKDLTHRVIETMGEGDDQSLVKQYVTGLETALQAVREECQRLIAEEAADLTYSADTYVVAKHVAHEILEKVGGNVGT